MNNNKDIASAPKQQDKSNITEEKVSVNSNENVQNERNMVSSPSVYLKNEDELDDYM